MTKLVYVWCYFVSLLIDYILYLVACVLCGWHGRAEVWCWCWHSVPNKLYWSRDWHCSQNNAELLWKICGLRLFIICYFSIWASIILCMLIAYVCSLFCYCWIDLRPNTLEGDFRKLRTSNTSCRLSCPMLILLVKLALKQLKIMKFRTHLTTALPNKKKWGATNNRGSLVGSLVTCWTP